MLLDAKKWLLKFDNKTPSAQQLNHCCYMAIKTCSHCIYISQLKILGQQMAANPLSLAVLQSKMFYYLKQNLFS